jgi:small subunit ribosomal protein S12e
MSDFSGVIEDGLKQINLSGRIAKGFNCTVKAIIKRKAKCVFLAEDCDAKDYKPLITGLCKKYDIPLRTVGMRAKLGSVFGLGRIKADGSVGRAIPCSACAVVKYGPVLTSAVEAFRAAFDKEGVVASE